MKERELIVRMLSALELTKNDCERDGWIYGDQSNVVKAIKAAKKYLGEGEGVNNCEFRILLSEARRKASAVGIQHALWDTILDGEALLRGEPSICSREVIEKQLREACRNM